MVSDDFEKTFQRSKTPNNRKVSLFSKISSGFITNRNHSFSKISNKNKTNLNGKNENSSNFKYFCNSCDIYFNKQDLIIHSRCHFIEVKNNRNNSKNSSFSILVNQEKNCFFEENDKNENEKNRSFSKRSFANRSFLDQSILERSFDKKQIFKNLTNLQTEIKEKNNFNKILLEENKKMSEDIKKKEHEVLIFTI